MRRSMAMHVPTYSWRDGPQTCFFFRVADVCFVPGTFGTSIEFNWWIGRRKRRKMLEIVSLWNMLTGLICIHVPPCLLMPFSTVGDNSDFRLDRLLGALHVFFWLRCCVHFIQRDTLRAVALFKKVTKVILASSPAMWHSVPIHHGSNCCWPAVWQLNSSWLCATVHTYLLDHHILVFAYLPILLETILPLCISGIE